MTTKHAKLSIFNGTSYIIGTELNEKTVHLTFDTGASYTQISLDEGISLNLKSHQSLLGTSKLGIGQLKVDYLCNVSISILGVTQNIVVKVSKDQQSLLGLETMIRLKLVFNTFSGEYSISDVPVDIENITPRPSFRFLNFSTLMEHFKLKESDLVPLKDLPDPQISYKKLLESGDTPSVIDLGESFHQFSLLTLNK